MRKLLFISCFLLALLASSICFASDVSSDKMIVEWTSEKVWLNNGELLVSGEMVNKRNDLSVTKLNEVNMHFIFTRSDGSVYEYTAQPKKLPMCRLPSSGRKKLTFNFGPFEDNWSKWVATAEVTFTFIEGARW